MKRLTMGQQTRGRCRCYRGGLEESLTRISTLMTQNIGGNRLLLRWNNPEDNIFLYIHSQATLKTMKDLAKQDSFHEQVKIRVKIQETVSL